MGLLLSKPEDSSEAVKSDPQIPSTPVSQQKIRKLEEIIDPRSPSANIIRTPIQLVTSPLASIDLENQNTSFDTFNINSPQIAKNNSLMDPRSPTLSFARTPIVIAKDDTESRLPKRLHNKNLDNVRKTTLIVPKKLGDMPSQVPPKLLESSPIKRETLSAESKNRRKSFVGFLETNLDYVETDLDAVFLSKSMSNLCEESKTPSKEQLKSKFLESCNFDFQMIKEDDKVIVEGYKDIIEDDKDIIEGNKVIIEDYKDIVEDDKVTVEDDGLIIKNTNTNEPPIIEEIVFIEQKTPEKVKELDDKEIVENIEPVIEFDKKITSLIYHDLSDEPKTPVIVKTIKESEKKANNRTPLGTRNANENIVKRSIPKLKVRDKPRKSDYAVSKIPVFKSNSSRLQEQCENTPPCTVNLSDHRKKLFKLIWV